MSGRRSVHGLALVPLIVCLWACTNTTGPASPSSYAAGCTSTPPVGQGPGVAVTEDSYSIALPQTAIPSGSVTFDVTNVGPSLHEFVVLRTNLPADGLPTEANGSVKTDVPGVTVTGEVHDVPSCATKTLTVDLKPGRYVLICNLPGHYAMGMWFPLVVA
jgi:hypothetical protein